MKRLFAILLVAVLATTYAMAGYGQTVPVEATFNVNVVQQLSVDENGDVPLPAIIINSTRTWTGIPMTFTISGEPYHGIIVTRSGPELVTAPAGGVLALDGTWNTANTPTALDVNGKALQIWTCTGATAGAVRGNYAFKFTVTALYDGM